MNKTSKNKEIKAEPAPGRNGECIKPRQYQITLTIQKNEVLEHSICGSDLENIRKPT